MPSIEEINTPTLNKKLYKNSEEITHIELSDDEGRYIEVKPLEIYTSKMSSCSYKVIRISQRDIHVLNLSNNDIVIFSMYDFLLIFSSNEFARKWNKMLDEDKTLC